jgi:hypothetical protein
MGEIFFGSTLWGTGLIMISMGILYVIVNALTKAKKV